MWITMSAAIGAVAASGDEGRASDYLLLWMKAHYRLPQRVRRVLSALEHITGRIRSSLFLPRGILNEALSRRPPPCIPPVRSWSSVLCTCWSGHVCFSRSLEEEL